MVKDIGMKYCIVLFVPCLFIYRYMCLFSFVVVLCLFFFFFFLGGGGDVEGGFGGIIVWCMIL